MNIEQFRNYCITKPHVEETFPFDDVTLVFKIGDKMFALMGLDNIDNPSANLKGDPENNIQLREEFEGINHGFHMNKKHWNTVSFESDVSDNLILQMIDDSYNLIVKSLTKKKRIEIGLI